jgi:hypothetical protein
MYIHKRKNLCCIGAFSNIATHPQTSTRICVYTNTFTYTHASVLCSFPTLPHTHTHIHIHTCRAMRYGAIRQKQHIHIHTCAHNTYTYTHVEQCDTTKTNQGGPVEARKSQHGKIDSKKCSCKEAQRYVLFLLCECAAP